MEPKLTNGGQLLLYRCRLGYRWLTGAARALPDFIIIGAQRSGTTSLYEYLVKHPAVERALIKETHFFDVHFRKGLRRYRAYFPLRYRKASRTRSGRRLVGEATPYYLMHPHVPRRVFEVLPTVKLISLLRNPIDRAFSHYQLERRLGNEDLSFEEAVMAERRVEQDLERMLADETFDSFNVRHYSYLARGRYLEQLSRWRSPFPGEQMLILSSEEFFKDPGRIVEKVCSFLDLPGWKPRNYPIYNSTSTPGPEPSFRRNLASYFRTLNESLYEYVGQDFGWDR